MLLTSDKSH